MPKAFPQEFREDVVRVFRDSDASIAQVAKDFGISQSCLQRCRSVPGHLVYLLTRHSAGVSPT